MLGGGTGDSIWAQVALGGAAQEHPGPQSEDRQAPCTELHSWESLGLSGILRAPSPGWGEQGKENRVH